MMHIKCSMIGVQADTSRHKYKLSALSIIVCLTWWYIKYSEIVIIQGAPVFLFCGPVE